MTGAPGERGAPGAGTLDGEARLAVAIEQVLAALEVSIGDLIALKEAVGRPVDLADVEALRALAAATERGP